MNNTTFKLRLPEEDLARWREKAGGQSLAEWIRDRCNAGEVAQVDELLANSTVEKQVRGKVVDTYVPAKRTPKQAKSAEACPHGALRQFCRFAECRSKR